jgi:hypothetical protein
VQKLGILYTEHGKVVEAEEMLQRALRGYEMVNDRPRMEEIARRLEGLRAVPK